MEQINSHSALGGQDMGVALPTLNQTSINIGSQMNPEPLLPNQNLPLSNTAQEQQNLIDSILPILSNRNGDTNRQLRPFNGNIPQGNLK